MREKKLRMNYKVEQVNGQKIYSKSSLPGSPRPPKGSEVYVRNIPRDIIEDELVSFFEKIGEIFELRLMMEFSGLNRGFCFVTYNNVESSTRAVELLHGTHIGRKKIRVSKSLDNCRLHVKDVPLNKSLEAIRFALSQMVNGIIDVIFDNKNDHAVINRGNVYVDFETHKHAVMARKLLWPSKGSLWGCQISTDWADPYEGNSNFNSPDEDTHLTNTSAKSLENNQYWTCMSGITPQIVESVAYNGDCDKEWQPLKVKIKFCPTGSSKFNISFQH